MPIRATIVAICFLVGKKKGGGGGEGGDDGGKKKGRRRRGGQVFSSPRALGAPSFAVGRHKGPASLPPGTRQGNDGDGIFYFF